MLNDIPIEVEKLAVEPGDLLHVIVGGDIGYDMPPWIPSPEELEEYRKQFIDLVPGIRVIATHHLVRLEVIKTSELEQNG